MTHAQTSTSEPTATTAVVAACQDVHLNVEEARIRSCANETCPVVGSASRYETLCVRGLADSNPAWLEIDLDPANDEAISGYINRTLVIPGPAGTDPIPASYCDEWEVLPAEAIVRAAPDTSREVVETLTTGDRVCVQDYLYIYRGWSSISQPNGASGWVNTENLRYVYDESLGCGEEITRQIISASTLHTCAGIECATSNSLPAGTNVCLNAESEDDALWMSFTMPERGGRLGWMRMDLLKPVDFVEQSAEATSEASVFTCTPFRVTGTTAINVRSEPSLSGDILSSLAPNTSICVVGTAGDASDWYAVNLSPEDVDARLGYVSNSLLTPIDPTATPESVAQVATEAGAETTQEVAVVATQDVTATVPAASVPLDLGVSNLPLICPLGANPLQPGACVTVTPTPAPVVNTPGNGVLLAKNVPLGRLFFSQSNTFSLVNTIDLTSPETSINLFFRLPDNWIPVDPLTLILNLNYSENISSFTDVTNTNLSSQFDVRIDNELVTTLSFNGSDVGPQTVEVPIPARLLNDPSQRFHSMELRLSAQDYCRVNTVTRVSINGDSSLFNFIYQETLPLLDLAYYPIPFYNRPIRGSEETAWLIVPDNPSDAEMQALGSVAAGIGRMTSNRLITHVAVVSEVTPQMWQGNNLYLIGTPDSNPLIRRLYDLNAFSSTINADGAIAFPQLVVDNDDGVLQLIANPDNPARAIMVVSGTSDVGLVKAGQALGGPPSLLNLGGPNAVISETRAIVRTTQDIVNHNAPSTYTLADLDVDTDVVLNGIGPQSFSFDFNLPLGGPLREDAYIDLIYNASDILDSSNASLSVLVNGIPIGSTTLNRGGVVVSDTSASEFSSPFRRLRVALPASAVSAGSNEVTVLADMQGDWGCDLPDFQSLWVTVSKNSEIFIPQESLLGEGLFPVVAQFPIPFASAPNLENLFISMPETVTTADLETLLELTQYLGNSNPFGEGYRPVIQSGEFDAGTDLSLYNFIVLGRPTTNSLLRTINDSLPQPFLEDSDEIVQELDDVSYRLIPGLDIGVIQLLESPWNKNNLMLVMTGTSGQGQRYAADALLDLAFGRNVLAGNIVYATQNDASSVDTRFVYSPQEVIENIGELVGQVPSAPQATDTPSNAAIMVVTATPTITLTPTVTGTFVAPTLFVTETSVATQFSTEEAPIGTLDPTTTDPTTVSSGADRPGWVLGIIALAGLVGVGLGGFAIYSAITQRNKKSDDDF